MGYRQGKIRQVATSTALSVVSLIAGLLIVEASVRMLDLAPPSSNQYGNNVPDQYLPFKPKPLSVSSGRSATDEFDYMYRHNSFGFRDTEHEFDKDEKTIRILGLGDSFTYGVGAEFEETYLYQLEKKLNTRQDRGANVEIIKVGIPRYFPEPQRILLERYGVNYAPDVIIVGFLPNDVIDTYLGVDAVVVHESGHLRSRESEQIGSFGMFLFDNSDLMRLLLKRYISYQISRKYPTYFEEVYQNEGYHEKDWKTVEKEYDKILSIARSIGSQVLFVHIPQRGPWTDRHEYPGKRLAKWASENGAGFIDILPSMREASKQRTLYYERDGHCNAEGYEVLAETIYQYIVKSGLVE